MVHELVMAGAQRKQVGQIIIGEVPIDVRDLYRATASPNGFPLAHFYGFHQLTGTPPTSTPMRSDRTAKASLFPDALL